MSNRRLIHQFMWAYQRTFRSFATTATQQALSRIGFNGDPKVLLVGFKVAGDSVFDICIEPEEGPYVPGDLSEVTSRAEELFQQSPERDMLYSDPVFRQEHHPGLRRHLRGEALAEILGTTSAGQGRSFFSSKSVHIGDYEVHVVISVESVPLDEVPRLRTTQRDRVRIPPSLVHALISESLERAAVTLYTPDPGRNTGVLGAEPQEVVRHAAVVFLRSVLYCAGLIDVYDADTILNAVSALPYEGRPGAGRLVIAEPSNPAVDVVLKLETPVDLRNTRAVRKLLEASGAGAGLLVGDGIVHGLGRLRPDYDESSETAFVVLVAGRGTWELHHGTKSLLIVRDSVPMLPSNVLDVKRFEDLVDRLLSDTDELVLTSLAQAVGQNQHGATLIVSSDAAGEAQRLSPQAWAVEPTVLTPELATQLTAMDGAILVDPQGHCHAIGVILDGLAAGQGDPSRGSRFNNAIRYLDSSPPPCIVIVYSADGSVDILPRLNARVERYQVELAVQHYLETAAAQPPHLPNVAEAWRAVKSFQFYLSEDQCSAVNTARATIDEWRKQNTMIWVIDEDLTVNPEMNDSYWLLTPQAAQQTADELDDEGGDRPNG